jgi:glutamate dehydrogenase (NAD(P)+)
VVEDLNYIPDLAGESKYRVADLITGYGVSESVRHFYGTYGGELKGKRVIVQGWGNVGAAAAFYLARAGAQIVGIIDRDAGLVCSEGMSIEKVTELFQSKKGNSLHSENLMTFEEVNEQIWDVKADVFLPCAASRLVTQDQLDRMISAGVKVISSGANVPFADREIFYGPIAESADARIAVIPDFIANCGMARVFAYLMSDANVDMSDKGIFQDTSETIKHALETTHRDRSNTTLLAATAFRIALEKRLD